MNPMDNTQKGKDGSAYSRAERPSDGVSMNAVKKVLTTPLQGDPDGLDIFKLKGHTRLTDCVIARVAVELPNATPADMAIALRNHAYSIEHDRYRLVEALRKCCEAIKEKQYESERSFDHSTMPEPALEAGEKLLRELGESA